MKHEKVTLLLEPISKCYIKQFAEALSNHPDIENRLTYSDGCWVSKEEFDCIDNCPSKEYRQLESDVSNICGAREYMSFIING